MEQKTKQMFGKYQILRRIATGGMAEILQAKTESIGGFQRSFAIKRVLPHLSQNKEYVAMLVDEAKVAGLLSHANIVQILDLGQIDKVWFIAMEYVAGADLGKVLHLAKTKGLVLPVPHSIFIAMELLSGLEYAHRRRVMKDGRPIPLNIVHRDISPPNILMSFQGEVKLTDFGIASASHKALETEVGIVKGRYDYMSPEQARGAKDLDCRSDIFSLGVVLYEMLAGQHPFRMETELGTLDRIRLGTYTPLCEANPAIPPKLGRIVGRALANERNERYATAKVLREALDEFFHESEFLFNHSTLAVYLKGLLPEGSGDTSLHVAPKDPSIDVELNVDSKDSKRTSKASKDSQNTGLSASLPDPSEWDDDLDTVVGRAVDLGTPTPKNRITDDLDEQETLIRPSTFTNPPADPGLLDLDLVPEPKGLTPVPAVRRESPTPKSKPATSSRAQTSKQPQPVATPQEKGASSMWPLIAMALFVVGLFLGSFLGTMIALVGLGA